jgi:hypothetical protein
LPRKTASWVAVSILIGGFMSERMRLSRRVDN